MSPATTPATASSRRPAACWTGVATPPSTTRTDVSAWSAPADGKFRPARRDDELAPRSGVAIRDVAVATHARRLRNRAWVACCLREAGITTPLGGGVSVGLTEHAVEMGDSDEA